MGFLPVLMQVAWLSVLFSGMAAAPLAAQLARPNCRDLCGGVQIPFPFGVTKNCSLNDDFRLRCDRSSGQLQTGNLNVINISVQGQLEIWMHMARTCVENGSIVVSNDSSLEVPSFTINNTQNRLVAVGCDSFGYVSGDPSYPSRSNQSFSRVGVSCVSRCRYPERSGGCQAEISQGLKNFSLTTLFLGNDSDIKNYTCSYAFLVKKGWPRFSHVLHSQDKIKTVPVVLDWAIGNETCDRSEPICGRNSECHNSTNGNGYRCGCKDGYDGNSYLKHGCQDIDECLPKPNNCSVNAKCENTPGNFTCHCKPGYERHGRGEAGCKPASGSNSASKIALAIGVSFAALVVAGSWLYLVFKQKKFIERKEKFFEQNGGLILKERLREQGGSTEGIKILTVEELEKATKNFDERSIIGRGGFGIVYKGILPGNRVIAIKRSRTVA